MVTARTSIHNFTFIVIDSIDLCLALIQVMALSCLAQCGAEMGSELGNNIVESSWKHLKSRAGYLLHYKKKVEKLQERFEHLKNVRNDINRSVETANRKGEVIKDVVTAWLEKVNELETEVVNLEKEVRQNERCLKGCSPNCRWRYQLGKEATKKKAVVEALLGEGKFESVSQLPPPPTIESTPMGDFMAFSSTRIVMDNVMNALEDENKHLIGIYGMGGVGKTTLMEEMSRPEPSTRVGYVMAAYPLGQTLKNMQGLKYKIQIFQNNQINTKYINRVGLSK